LASLSISLAAIVAAGVILLTGWYPIDPLLSVLVALLILISAWRVVRQSTHILLPDRPMLTLHVTIDEPANCRRVLADVKRVLRNEFHIAHSTVQVEPVTCIDETLADETPA